MNTVLLFAVAAFLMTAGLFLIRLDRRDRTPPTIPLPVIDPGRRFHDTWDHRSDRAAPVDRALLEPVQDSSWHDADTGRG